MILYTRTDIWEYLTDRNPFINYHIAEYTTGGTANGSRCAFPFTYKGVSYDECITLDHDDRWCSTTSVYNGTWGNCAGETH